MITTVKDIIRQLDIMLYFNIISFSVLSGSGTVVSPSLHDLDIIEELCKDMPPNQKPYNVMFMNSLYKRNIPLYAKDIKNPYDFESYQWLDMKRKKNIDIEVMASSIISCCSIIERLITNQLQLENNQFIAFILFKTALHQAKFIKKHLKIGDVYYCGEDVSLDAAKELHIQITSKKPNSISQLYVLQAFTALNRLNTYNLPFMQYNENEFNEDMSLLGPIYDIVLENIKEIKSRALTSIGLCITGIYVNCEAPSKTTYKVLDRIGTELQERINENGEIARTESDVEKSSTGTLCNCLNLLSQLFYMFGDKAYYNACTKIYRRLDFTWNREHCIFMLKDSNKQLFSIKDISAIIAALLSFYCITEDSKLTKQIEEQIKGFYEKTLIKSKIFVNQVHPIIQQNIMESFSSIEAAKDTAPVFNKSFEYKVSKAKFYYDADVFRADYVLPSCCLLLNTINSYCI
ncbi:MAG: hypothetical protein WBL93_00235 [Lutisporaceae bacterium]